MVFCIGFILGVLLNSYLSVVYSYMVGKAMGFEFRYLRFYFWDISKINGENYCTNRRFSPLFQIQMIKPKLTDKEDWKYATIQLIVDFIVSGTVFLLAFILYKDEFDFFVGDMANLAIGVGAGFLYLVLFRFAIYAQYYFNKNKSLIDLLKKIGNDFRNDYPLEYMNLPPLENLNIKGFLYERQTYQNYRYMQKICQEAYHEIPPIVEWMENNLSESLLKTETNTYYNILYYYTYLSYNEEKARKYFQIIYEELINDIDSNGRRILAYYQCYVLKNPILARQTAIDGLNVLPKFSICNAERVYEAGLLNNLIRNIDEYMGQVYTM